MSGFTTQSGLKKTLSMCLCRHPKQDADCLPCRTRATVLELLRLRIASCQACGGTGLRPLGEDSFEPCSCRNDGLAV